MLAAGAYSWCLWTLHTCLMNRNRANWIAFRRCKQSKKWTLTFWATLYITTVVMTTERSYGRMRCAKVTVDQWRHLSTSVRTRSRCLLCCLSLINRHLRAVLLQETSTTTGRPVCLPLKTASVLIRHQVHHITVLQVRPGRRRASCTVLQMVDSDWNCLKSLRQIQHATQQLPPKSVKGSCFCVFAVIQFYSQETCLSKTTDKPMEHCKLFDSFSMNFLKKNHRNSYSG